jgi:cyclomaltodextrinase
MTEPGWVEHAIWWHVYPLGFVGAEKEAPASGTPVSHRLSHLCSWLDYAVDLGVSGLALGPIFASETHGYDTTDYYRIDPRLGDEADFVDLIIQAHARGLKVLLDGVFNHTGRSFGPFQQVLREGPGAATERWFRLSWPDGGWAHGCEPGYRDFEGHHHLVALNHEEPDVAEFVIDVMKHWLARSADGWRLDAAYAVPSAFWQRVLGEVRREYPAAYFVGEYIHGDYAHEVDAGALDSATQYELWKAIWSSLNDANFYELAAALNRHNAFLEAFAPLNFVGNHDVTRLASKLKNPDRLPLALVVLLTVGGTPSIYYGDEQAFRGIKEDRAGGDDAVRPSFSAKPADLAKAGWPIYHLHRELIGLRRRHPWLHRARTKVFKLSNEHLVYEATADTEAITIALNLSAQTATLPIPPTASAVLAGNGDLLPYSQTVKLPGHGWALLTKSVTK